MMYGTQITKNLLPSTLILNETTIGNEYTYNDGTDRQTHKHRRMPNAQVKTDISLRSVNYYKSSKITNLTVRLSCTNAVS